jgi:AcrR family transcriptional regulator
MARQYTLKRRAERQEETRKRIAEAALELHSTIGPVRTTVSAIAERAGVQRHTFYRHFPTELALGEACSGLAIERDPPPEAELWERVGDPEVRIRLGLSELYAYFERNEQLLSNILRDAEVDPVTAELVERRLDRLRAMVDVLEEPFGVTGKRRARLRATLELAVSFRTWQTLASHSGLARRDCVDVMVRAVRCAAQ